MSYLYYLVGPPGSGKRTVGKALSALMGAALLDNHLANDPIFLAAGVRGDSQIPAHIWELCFAVSQAIRAATLHAPRAQAHIFTNYLANNTGERDSVEHLRDLAEKRGAAFVPVWLICPLSELERRMLLPERAEKLKLRDPLQLRELLEKAGTLPPPSDALVLDTSIVQPTQAARQIAEFAKTRST